MGRTHARTYDRVTVDPDRLKSWAVHVPDRRHRAAVAERHAARRRGAPDRRDPPAGPVRHRPPRARRRADPADDRRLGRGGGHDHADHPVGRQEHDRPRRRSQPGEAITDVAGPLGSPTELIESGHAVCVGGGVGTAVILPIAQELAGARRPGDEHHRRPVARVGHPRAGAARPAARSIACTDDGSYGRPGFVTAGARGRAARGGVDAVYAVGPVPMMRAVQRAHPRATASRRRVAQRDHGRRHRHVRRLPRLDRRRRPATPASTARSSTATRSTSHELADRLTHVPRVRAGGARPARGLQDPGHGGRGRPVRDRGRPMSDEPLEAPKPRAADTPGDRQAHPRRRARRARSAPADGDRPGRRCPSRTPTRRSHSFDEVNLGFTEQLAVLEAERCLQCKKPHCVDGCPVGVDIPRFIEPLARRRPGRRRRLAARRQRAARRDRPGLPAGDAVRGPVPARRKKGTSRSAIGYLERYVADWAQAHPRGPLTRAPPSRERGSPSSGPARPA